MADARLKLVVQGAMSTQEVAGLDAIADQVDVSCATTLPELEDALPGAEVLLGWDFRAGDVERAWSKADRLRWIQWGGAGVDALLFPGLVNSDVVVTNAGGLFDRPMAEYALGCILMHAKRIRESLDYQARSEWNYRLNSRVAGQRAVIVGVGRIGREIGRVLRAVGMEVIGVGRRARGGDPDFGQVYGVAELTDVLPSADYLILIAPMTPENRNLIGAPQLAAMKPDGYLINLGRGELLDEQALLVALDSGALAGATLDVFREEPLPENSAFWQRKDIFVSPHLSGDYFGHRNDVAALFLDNLARYQRGEPLTCVVDKQLGFVPSPSG